MDKNNLKDAYDIGENMAVFSGEGRSYTIINKETGKTRQLVSEDGSLLVTDNEIDFDAIYKGCPDFNGCKSVRYWFGTDMTISEMVFVPSAGQYIPMDATLLMRMVSEWKIMTKRMLIALSIRTWKSSCLFNQWTM